MYRMSLLPRLYLHMFLVSTYPTQLSHFVLALSFLFSLSIFQYIETTTLICCFLFL
jgi:hypothetical protein